MKPETGQRQQEAPTLGRFARRCGRRCETHQPSEGAATPRIRASAVTSPRRFGLRGRMDWALASQNGVIAQAEFDDRARPNDKEFSGERSESAATTG